MSFLYSSSIQRAQFVPGYLPSPKPRLLEWAKSGGYIKAIKIFCNVKGTVGFFYYYFLKCGSHFAFFHSKPNVRNSCTDGNF